MTEADAAASSDDLSAGVLAASEVSGSNESLTGSMERRIMRRWAFGSLLLSCLVFLIGLLVALIRMLWHTPSAAGSAYGELLIGFGLAVFAVVPLSLAVAITRLASEERRAPEKAWDIPITTPVVEFAKVLVDLAKGLRQP